jgi:pilus assembly protein Flp/PilA
VDAIRRTLRAFGLDDRGATAIEYALIAGLIAVAMAGALSNLGGGVGGMWSDISADVTGAM